MADSTHDGSRRPPGCGCGVQAARSRLGSRSRRHCAPRCHPRRPPSPRRRHRRPQQTARPCRSSGRILCSPRRTPSPGVRAGSSAGGWVGSVEVFALARIWAAAKAVAPSRCSWGCGPRTVRRGGVRSRGPLQNSGEPPAQQLLPQGAVAAQSRRANLGAGMLVAVLEAERATSGQDAPTDVVGVHQLVCQRATHLPE